MPEPLIERAVASVADRVAVDWDALEREAESADDKALLDCLRILGGIGNLHRTLDLDTANSDRPTVATAAPAPGVAPIEAWGRYQVNQVVGEGGFGRVYRAWDPELQFDVAIKVLRATVADARIREALLREGRALAKVRHPNVVSVFGVEAHGDHIGLCMEFVHGDTLEQLIERNGTMNARQAALVCQDVCRALAAVHLAGYVHRDVKARNVMQDRTGRIVLMDFGAGQEAQLTMPNRANTVGTPLYMAPEVLAGESATPGSDVYSVGVLLYHLVTNEYPVEGRTLDDLRGAHMLGRRRSLSERRPDLPIPFLQVVDRALSPDPARRYRNAAQFLDALVKVLDERKISPRVAVATQLLRAAFGVSLLIVGLTALGAIISKEFNSVLGRTEFAVESLRDWLAWGAASFVMPGVVALLALSVLGLLFVIRYAVLRTSKQAGAAEAALATAAQRAARRLRLDDRTTCACVCLIVVSAALSASWWWFASLIGAMFDSVSTAPRESLALLSPANESHHLTYRVVLTAVTTAAGVVVFAVGRLLPRRTEIFEQSLRLAALAVLALSVFYLAMPYRILRFARFPEVRWQNERCFTTGQRPDATLLFCPDRFPRNVVVPTSTGTPEPTGVTRNIFSVF